VRAGVGESSAMPTPLPPPHVTHEVLNQPPPLVGYDLFTTDRALAAGLDREGASWASADASALGTAVGGDPVVWGQQAKA